MTSPTQSPERDPADAFDEEILATLEERLGYRFRNRAYLIEALTHKTFANENHDLGVQDNERLEFLGDAVLDLAATHLLMERFPHASEGELSRHRAALVNESQLNHIARRLELGQAIRLGKGEEKTGGREKTSLLADAYEAVLAALYLDGGLEEAIAAVHRHLGDGLDAPERQVFRDFKTTLQEFAQGKLRTSPRYHLISEEGPDHEKVFTVEVSLMGEVHGRGQGRSKKEAEQTAAAQALKQIFPKEER